MTTTNTQAAVNHTEVAAKRLARASLIMILASMDEDVEFRAESYESAVEMTAKAALSLAREISRLRGGHGMDPDEGVEAIIKGLEKAGFGETG